MNEHTIALIEFVTIFIAGITTIIIYMRTPAGKETDHITPLCNEYETWCTINGLPHYSADELLCLGTTQEQTAWLRDFINRWDHALDMEAVQSKEIF